MKTAHMKVKLQSVPAHTIPPIGSKHRIMLELYLDGKEVRESDLTPKLGRNFRGIFQALTGDRFGHWHFIDVIENGIIEARYLDKRHLSGDYNQDKTARAERKIILKSKSHKVALLGASRVPKSQADLCKAYDELNELENETLDMEYKLKLEAMEEQRINDDLGSE